MEHKRKLTDEEISEIEVLVSKAINAWNKEQAHPFIEQLEFIKRTIDVAAPQSNIFAELVAYVKTASGQVKEKEHWINAVKQSLYKLKMF